MSKAILIMDMPSSCINCPLSKYECDCMPEDYCMTRDKEIINKYSKPEWCPLREIPERKDETWDIMNMEDSYYNEGWNHCIDTILKEGAE